MGRKIIKRIKKIFSYHSDLCGTFLKLYQNSTVAIEKKATCFYFGAFGFYVFREHIK